MGDLLAPPLDEIFLEQAEGLRKGALESTAVLAKLIAPEGLAISVSHVMAPLSGYEHVISRVLDLVAEKKERPLAQHAAWNPSSLATLLTTAIWKTAIPRRRK